MHSTTPMSRASGSAPSRHLSRAFISETRDYSPELALHNANIHVILSQSPLGRRATTRSIGKSVRTLLARSAWPEFHYLEEDADLPSKKDARTTALDRPRKARFEHEKVIGRM